LISRFWKTSPEVETAAFDNETTFVDEPSSICQPDFAGGGSLTAMSPAAPTSALRMPCFFKTFMASSAA